MIDLSNSKTNANANNSISIPRCYDSHVHWMGTGSIINLIDLSQIQSLEDFRQKATEWNHPNRGSWFVGFGWDNSLWKDSFRPHHRILDEFFPDHPVSFIRADGHSTWINKKAMTLLGIEKKNASTLSSGGRVEVDQNGHPTGVMIDGAKDYVDQFIPPLSRQEIKNNLMLGMEVFLKAGFTHIRDVGGCQTHWELASEIYREGHLKLYVEMFFNLDDASKLSERIQQIIESRTAAMALVASSVSKANSNVDVESTSTSASTCASASILTASSSYESTPTSETSSSNSVASDSFPLRIGGLKFYYDGALGSDGAYLSQNYKGKEHCGLRLMEPSQIEEIIQRCWEQNIPVAIHTLGDEAVHQVVQVAQRLKTKGLDGQLNLEHCEVVRDETIALMKSLNVHCHLQPSHFLSDRRWLKDKLGTLYQYCFPWKKLIDAGIAVSFGSDSPIEPPSLKRTKEALQLASQEGIALPALAGPLFLHSHPDEQWGPECATIVNREGEIVNLRSR